MKSLFTMALTVLAVLLLSSGGLLVTHAATPIAANENGNQNGSASQALTMILQGGVASAGNQTYLIQQNGLALGAFIGTDPIVSTHLSYTLNAVQNGVATTGSASFQLTGMDAVTGAKVTVSANLAVIGSIPAICLPSGNITGVCASGDTSEVPGAFVAVGQVSMNGATPTIVTMILESAYFDPFGNAITLSSMDGSINIATNYTRATIDWSSVIDAGSISGTLGSTAISGYFQQFATEHENLVAGVAQDSGVLSLSVTDSSGNQIDASGNYVGSSSIPHTGSFSCGLACTETGFQDRGSFHLQGLEGTSSVMITGTYATSWTVPAFGFQSSVSGQVIQN